MNNNWLPPSLSAIKADILSLGTALDQIRSNVANVKDSAYGATGSAQTTFGVATAGSAVLPVTSAIDFKVGDGIWVAGASAAGVDLVTSITALNGNTLTLAAAASTSAGNPQVTHDDTAAIQRAIDSFGSVGGPVYLPSGYYRISAPTTNASALTLKDGTFLTGSSADLYSGPTGKGVTLDGFHVNGSGSTALNMTTTFGSTVAHMLITGSLTYTANYGVKTGNTTTLDDVYFSGFANAIYNNQGIGLLLSRVSTQGSRFSGVLLTGSKNVRIWHSWLTNSGAAGAGAASTGNLEIIGVAGQYMNIIVDSCIIDENFGAGTPNVHLDANAHGVVIRDCTILANDTPANSGYGIFVEPTAGDLHLHNVRMDTFGGAGTAGMIVLSAGSTGNVLQNVTTVPHGGTDIVDNATGTIMLNVNGSYKLPNLRTTDPGAGTKQLWADPADSYRVKLAN